MRRPGRLLVLFAEVTTLALFAVVVLGFVDTATGSALGCGRSFPLCNGSFFPAPNLNAVIEWSHRVLSALVGVLVGVLAIWTWIRVWRSIEARWLAAVSLVFLTIEASVGALAVLIPESQAVIAVHLGIALTSFAATALLAGWLLAMRAQGGNPGRPRVPTRLAASAWGMLVLMYCVVYLGAYVAGTSAGSACLTWPLCTSGQVTLSLSNPVTIDYVHRLAALVVGAATMWLWLQARAVAATRPDLARISGWMVILTVAQIGSGLLLVLSRLALDATILHVMLITVLFTLSAAMALGVLPEAGADRQRKRAGASSPESAAG